MTKEQFIELIKGQLTSADPNPDVHEKYHEKRIELFISMGFNNVIYEVFANNMDDKDLYLRSYVVDIEYDDRFEEYFAELPAQVIQLPRNLGIHKVSPVTQDWSFAPINQNSVEAYSELPISQIMQEPTYYYTSNRIYFQLREWKDRLIDKVRIDMVVPFEEYADTDQLFIPAGKEQVILEFVFQMMGQQLPADHTQNLNDLQV